MLENDLDPRALPRRARRRVMSAEDVAALDRLLDLPDNELWDLIVGRAEPAIRDCFPWSPRCVRLEVVLRDRWWRADSVRSAEGESRCALVATPAHECPGGSRHHDRPYRHAVSFSDGSPSVDFPDPRGDDGPGRHRHPHALREDREASPTTRASCRRPRATRRSPTSTATRASSSTAAIRSRSSRVKCDFLEVCHLLLYGELPERGAAEGLRSAA